MMKAPESGFDAMAPENVVAARRVARQRGVARRHGPRVRGRGRRDRVADGWRTGPRVDKGARWEPAEVGAGRARAAREGGAAAEGVRDLSRPHELRLHRGAGGAARDGARVPRRALVPRSACAPRWRASAATTPTLWKRDRRASSAGRRSRSPRSTAGSGSARSSSSRCSRRWARRCSARRSSRASCLAAQRAPGRRATREQQARVAARRSPRASASRRSRCDRGERRWDADGDRRGARRDGGDFVLARRASATSLDGAQRRPARRRGARAGARGDDGVALFARARRRAGPRARARSPTMDQTRRLAELALRGVRVPAARAARRRGRGAGPALERTLELARASRSPPSRSAARSAASTSPSRTRRSACSSAGRSARFQAIKHKCADMMVRVETARSAAYCAALRRRASGGARAPARRPRSRRPWRSEPYFRCAAERAPDPRRRRLHLGVRRAPLLQARARRARRCSATPPGTASASRARSGSRRMR